jgi:hypothetical protein
MSLLVILDIQNLFGYLSEQVLKFSFHSMKAMQTCLLAVLPVISFASINEAVEGVAESPLLIAAGGSWEDFARIRRGEKNTDQEAIDPAPELKKPVNETIKRPARQSAPQPVRARPQTEARANARLISMPDSPTESGSSWAFYRGTMDVDQNNWYDPHGIDFAWAYAHNTPLPADARIVVFLHGAGGGERAMWAFSPSPRTDIEVRVQDAEVYNPDWREWWSYSADSVAYPGRRIVAALEFVEKRHSVDSSQRGLVFEGASMGGGGAVMQAMILPPPWRALIAYVSGHLGVLMPRRVSSKTPALFASLPPNGPRNKALWESLDFALQAKKDPIVRGIHFRQSFSTNDPFNEGLNGNTQLEFVNVVERTQIGGAFSWVNGGQWMEEEGVRMPDLANFETVEQDVTLDRAHPAFTRSTGNYPIKPGDRVNEASFPRGHYNMGLLWKHADIIDDASQIVFPLRYLQRTNFGKGIPDQPRSITVSVTPRRPRHFSLIDGESLSWSWDDGALSGRAMVRGDTVSVHRLPLISGEPYKNLRIYRE